ncbi:hypothetical protein Rhal01_02338 [Rubritalea halochordaticola]|uniref:DUF1080 domain-containing protein n=1 Tax=Rubritalea halochordaticola TaxID=714537 RepID=A0ABP9V0E5_9BACT
MNRILLPTLLFSSLLPLSAEEDLLNFKNNDTLHGSFNGFSAEGKLVWTNQQAEKPISFATSEIRRVIFNKGLLTKPFTHTHTVTLINGDVLPCEILSIDESKCTIRTDYAGTLQINRNQVYNCEIQPHGQQVLYQGPFVEDNWKTVAFKEEEEDESQKVWEYANFSWLNDGHTGAIINQNTELPDAFRMTFKAEMARYSNIYLAFHANLSIPERKEEDDTKEHAYTKSITENFGSCLLLRITSGVTYLSQYSFDDNGAPIVTKIPTTLGSTSARYSSEDYADTHFELRVDRQKKVVSSYADGALIAQWNLSDIGYEAKGNKFGFANLNGSNRISRISNIVMTPWNGIKDSALSLQNEQRDIALLNNGTDRFSGKILKLQDNVVTLKGPYAEMEIPTDQVKSLNFATEGFAKKDEARSNDVAFRFYGSGRLTANPVSGNEEGVELEHPILGKLKLKYTYLSSIDYTPDASIIDRWNLQLK